MDKKAINVDDKSNIKYSRKKDERCKCEYLQYRSLLYKSIDIPKLISHNNSSNSVANDNHDFNERTPILRVLDVLRSPLRSTRHEDWEKSASSLKNNYHVCY